MAGQVLFSHCGAMKVTYAITQPDIVFGIACTLPEADHLNISLSCASYPASICRRCYYASHFPSSPQ